MPAMFVVNPTLPLLAGALIAGCTSMVTAPTRSAICLSSGANRVVLPANHFTLSWTHSIEKIAWDEDWRLDADALVLVEARVRGSGAGMEPAPGARLIDGVWHYTVARRESALLLAHSPYVAGYTLCAAGRCQPMIEWLPYLPPITQVRFHACTP